MNDLNPCSEDYPMTRQDVHDLLRRLFDAFTNPATTPEQFTTLMTPDYVQEVDGKRLDFEGFVRHAHALHASIASSTVTFEQIVTDGLTAATIHTAEAVKKSGESIRLKVIAYYRFAGRRLSYVEELTHLVQGSADDRDIGSRM